MLQLLVISYQAVVLHGAHVGMSPLC